MSKTHPVLLYIRLRYIHCYPDHCAIYTTANILTDKSVHICESFLWSMNCTNETRETTTKQSYIIIMIHWITFKLMSGKHVFLGTRNQLELVILRLTLIPNQSQPDKLTRNYTKYSTKMTPVWCVPSKSHLFHLLHPVFLYCENYVTGDCLLHTWSIKNTPRCEVGTPYAPS